MSASRRPRSPAHGLGHPLPAAPAGPRPATGTGPPGWNDYAEARARFFARLEVDALERLWAAEASPPARRPRG